MEVSNEHKFKLWVVDDNQDMCDLTVDLLEEDFEVRPFLSGSEAFSHLKSCSELQKPDIILTDYRMPRLDGLAFAKEVIEHSLEVPVMLMTGAADFEFFKKALSLGVVGVVEKPFSPDDILQALKRAVVRSVLDKLNLSIEKKVEAAMALSKDLLAQYLHRYVTAENKLFENPDFFTKISHQERKSILDQIYKQNEISKVLKENFSQLENLVRHTRYLRLLLER